MPIDFGAMRSTGMTAVAYNNLKKYLGLSTETTKIYDIWQQLAEPEMNLIERFHGGCSASFTVWRLPSIFRFTNGRWERMWKGRRRW